MKEPLAGFDTEPQHIEWLAEEFGRHWDPRTLRNWRNEADGLPYTTAGKTVLYRREWTIAWLESRRTVRNPIRAGRRRRRLEERREQRGLGSSP